MRLQVLRLPHLNRTAPILRHMTPRDTSMGKNPGEDKLTPTVNPAPRVSGSQEDVWAIIRSAIAASPAETIINMGQGLFDYNPPKFLLDAARQSLDRVECNQYSPSSGRPRLKRAIAELYSATIGREIEPESEVAITSGANEGMLSVFMAFLSYGDEVIVFEPFFDQYISNIEMAGAKPSYVMLKPPSHSNRTKSSSAEWTFDLRDLDKAITPRTKMIIVNTPNNPTGKIFSHDELLAIAKRASLHNLLILSDEVYDKLCYTPFARIASLSTEVAKRTITVGSVGKDFYATGWRIGYLIGPANLIRYAVRAHTRICFTSVSPLQEAAAIGYEEAGRHGFWEASRSLTLGKLRRFNEIWIELRLPYCEPQGGYFVVVDFSRVQIPPKYEFPSHIAERARDFKLAWFLVHELGIAAIPPSEFYTKENGHIVENYLRFGVTRTDDALDKAKEQLRRLKQYIY